MQLRIGINVGDVMVKDGDIFGDGVNIAARLESAGRARRHLRHARRARPAARPRRRRFEDLGEHSVKNIPRPVRVFRVIFDPHAEPRLPGNRAGGRAGSARRRGEEAELDRLRRRSRSGNPCRRATTTAEYRIYLERYPEGAFAELRRARLRGIGGRGRAGHRSWRSGRRCATSGDARMLRAYLEKYPEGEFRALAEIMLSDLDRASR